MRESRRNRPSRAWAGEGAGVLTEELRELIREVLRDELQGGDREPVRQVREEQVVVESDADLRDFANRILELAQDPSACRQIQQGSWVFRLSRSGGGAATNTGKPAETAEFSRGLVSERQIGALPDETKVVRVGRTVRFTPLALDELRRRGVKIERTKR